MDVFDLAEQPLRELNRTLHGLGAETNRTHWRVTNPRGKHALAAGVDAPVTIEIEGHAGYYCAGMNKQATVVVHGSAGVGVAENMMSGFRARARGCEPVGRGDGAWRAAADRRQCVGAVRDFDEGRGHRRARVGGTHVRVSWRRRDTWWCSAMPGRTWATVCTRRSCFVAGSVASLGSDCVEKPVDAADLAALHGVLDRAGLAGEIDATAFRRYGSARTLYHFHVDNAGAY